MNNKPGRMLFLLLVFFLSAAQPLMAQDTIKVGVFYNLTGGFGSIDGPALNGVRLKLNQVNASGGVLGKKLEIISVDTRSDYDSIAAGAIKLLGRDIVAGLGYSDTTSVLAGAPFFQSRGMPFVASGATHPGLPENVGDCLFMVAFGDNDQAHAMADYAYEKLGCRKVAVWTDNSMDFTRSLARYFKKSFSEKGGEITFQDVFQTNDKDFSAQISRLKKQALPDALFVAALPREAGKIIKQVRDAGLSFPILSGDGFDTELVACVPGPARAHDVYFSTHAFRGDDRPLVRKFVSAYKQANGHPPENAFAALGYDAMGLLVDAIDRAGTTEKGPLKEALRKTENFQGVTGAISYSRKSGVPIKPVAIVEVKKGKFILRDTWTPKKKKD